MIYNLQTIDTSCNDVSSYYIECNISEEKLKFLIDEYNSNYDNIGKGTDGFIKFLRTTYNINVKIVEVKDIIFSEYDSS